jgi:hypothetical protein
MASIKKQVFGPLTAHAEEAPAVKFVGPANADGKPAQEVTISLSDLSPEIVTRLALHGLSQKIGDSYAGAAAEPNPTKYSFEQIEDVIGQLKRGEWRVTAAGGPKATLLAKAIARVTGRDLDDVVEMLEGLDDDDTTDPAGKVVPGKKSLQKHPAIVQAKADIKLEEAQKAKERAAGKSTGEAPDLSTLLG